jgi:hypothetical protein
MVQSRVAGPPLTTSAGVYAKPHVRVVEEEECNKITNGIAVERKCDEVPGKD